MANDALKRASKKSRQYFAEGGDVINYDQIQPEANNVSQNVQNPNNVQNEIQSSPQQPHSGNMNVMSPEGELVSVAPEQLQDALSTGFRLPNPEEEAHGLNKDEFGSTGQQVIAGLEGAGEAATFGLSPALETGLGLTTPERIRARAEENPGSHMLGQGLGLAATAAIPALGEANILKAGGEGLVAAAGLAKASGLIEQVGAQAIKGAFDMAILQGGEEVSKALTQDPTQTAETAIANIGLSTVMGGVFGGTIGALLHGASRVAPEAGNRIVSELDKPAMDAGDFETSVKNSGFWKPNEQKGILAALGKAKPEAAEIKAAGERLGAPVMEGMVSDSPLIQKAEDSLINGVPTYSGIKRQELYRNGYGIAKGAVDDALGEGSTLSKAELGNRLKQGITFNLEEQNKPIEGMYNALKQGQQIIPLAKDAGETIARDLADLQELKIAPSSPEGMLVKRTMSEVPNLKTVDDIKAYKSILQRSISPTAPAGERRMAGIIADKLTDLEESSIEAAAKAQGNPELLGLISARKLANSEYKNFISKVRTLSEQLGKGRVYGVQDALNFIHEKLTPEEIVSKLYSKKDSEFLKFFSKEFPEQMDLMRAYQKGAIREVASKTGEMSPKLVFNQVNKLEPEVKASIFTKEELQKLKDSETYIRAMPKNFNPSGTAHVDAFRGFFEHPMGAVIANARDMGLEKFIKLASASPEINKAAALGKAAVKGQKDIMKGINNLFRAADDVVVPPHQFSNENERSKLDKMVSKYLKNPEQMSTIGDNNPLPEFSQIFASTSARAVQYLSSMRPDTAPKGALDARMPANAPQKAAYDRALDTAAAPLSVLNRIRDNTLTVQDISTLSTIYPSLYKKLSGDIMDKVMEVKAKGGTIPYQTRMSLGTFLAQPLDSTFTPQGIMSAQPIPTQQPQGPQQGGGQSAQPKKTTSALSKLPQSYQTPNQARAQRGQRPD